MRAFLVAAALAAGHAFVAGAHAGAPLSFDEALARARERGLDVRLARAEASASRAEGARLEAGPMLAPEASAQAGPCWGPTTTACVQTSLAFPLPIAGEGGARRRFSAALARRADARVAGAALRAEWSAAAAYLEARATRDDEALAEEGARLAQETLRAIAVRRGLGASAALDEAEAAATLARRARARDEAAAARIAAEAELARRLGEPAPRMPSDSLDAILAALARRAAEAVLPPEVLFARLAADAARADAVFRRARAKPRFSLVASYQRDDALHQTLVGVSVPLSIFSSVPAADVAVAEARARAFDEAAEIAALAFARARLSAQRAGEGRRRARRAVEAEIGRADAVLELCRRAHAEGHLPLFRLLAAQEALLRARRALLSARLEEGRVRLRVLAGGAP